MTGVFEWIIALATIIWTMPDGSKTAAIRTAGAARNRKRCLASRSLYIDPSRSPLSMHANQLAFKIDISTGGILQQVDVKTHMHVAHTCTHSKIRLSLTRLNLDR